MEVRAHQVVCSAVKAGTLTRPTACTRCALNTVKPEAHHEDYDNPLQVEWLCKRCHDYVHGRVRSVKGQMELWYGV